MHSQTTDRVEKRGPRRASASDDLPWPPTTISGGLARVVLALAATESAMAARKGSDRKRGMMERECSGVVQFQACTFQVAVSPSAPPILPRCSSASMLRSSSLFLLLHTPPSHSSHLYFSPLRFSIPSRQRVAFAVSRRPHPYPA